MSATSDSTRVENESGFCIKVGPCPCEAPCAWQRQVEADAPEFFARHPELAAPRRRPAKGGRA